MVKGTQRIQSLLKKRVVVSERYTSLITNHQSLKMSFLLYGANGYTGQLIVAECVKLGVKPVIAGRNEAKIKPIAEQYGLDYKIFSLDDTATMDSVLQDFEMVLHCAGPYVFTTEPMVEACLRTKTHYLDISGRIEGFEYNFSKNAAAKLSGIMLLPGVGFDVVPSDCLVAYLHSKMPDATHLVMGIAMKNGGVSHGTAASAVQNLGQYGKVRKAGKIIEVDMAAKSRQFDFGGEYQSLGVIVPWGDVSTAYYTAQIPNIEAYMATAPMMARVMKLTNSLRGLLKTNFIKNIAKRFVDNRGAGPSSEERATSTSFFYGEVKNAKGEVFKAYLKTQEAYTLTARLAAKIATIVHQGKAIKTGFQTPGALLGADFILEFEDTVRRDL